MCQVGRTHIVALALRPEYGMEALEVEGQTDQAPLARGGLCSAQGELAKAEHLLDDANHRFDGAFTCAIDSFAQCCLELVGHLYLGTRVLERRIGQRREALLPTRMMGITTCGDRGLDTAFRTRGQRRRAKIPCIEGRRLWRADLGRDGRQRGLGFLSIVGVIGEGTCDDERTLLIHGDLHVVILLEARIGRVFRNARLWIGKVVLVTVAGPRHGRRRWATTWTMPRRALPLCALRQLCLILRLLGCCTLGGTRFQHRFGFRQPRQAVLSPCHLLAHH